MSSVSYKTVSVSCCRAFAPRGDYTAILDHRLGNSCAGGRGSSHCTPAQNARSSTTVFMGRAWLRWRRFHGFELVELTFPWTSQPDLGQIDRTLRDDPAIEVVSLVHHETTTGLLNPVATIREWMVIQHGRVLLVDSDRKRLRRLGRSTW